MRTTIRGNQMMRALTNLGRPLLLDSLHLACLLLSPLACLLLHLLHQLDLLRLPLLALLLEGLPHLLEFGTHRLECLAKRL